MAIKINDIPPEGMTLELSDTIDLYSAGTAAMAFTAVLTIRPEGKGSFHVSGTVEATPELECNRCLKRFPYPIRDSGMSFDLIPEGLLKLGHEHELGRAELDVDFFQGDEIEPLDYVREQLLLNIPMVPVHNPECKGLCPVCGTDLNVADCGCKNDLAQALSPFAELKKLQTRKE
jgi:uncharacterized protein